MHTYPWARASAQRLKQLKEDTLAECRPPGRGKPCWLTEWGLPAAGAACPGDDAPRAALMREMLADFGQLTWQGQLTGMIYYAWSDDKYGIHRCGVLTESGRLALDSKVFE